MSQQPEQQYWNGKPWPPPQEPKKKSSNALKALAIAGAALVAIVVIANIVTPDDEESPAEAVSTSEVQQTTTAASTTTRPFPSGPLLPAPSRAPAQTSAAPPMARPALTAAASATEAGCDEPDASMVSTISESLTEGRTLGDVASVSTLVGGIDYEYVSGNVYAADGHREHSAVVWVSPGVGVMGLSGSSRRVSTLPFGRSILNVSAGDEFGMKAQECTLALGRGAR